MTGGRRKIQGQVFDLPNWDSKTSYWCSPSLDLETYRPCRKLSIHTHRKCSYVPESHNDFCPLLSSLFLVLNCAITWVHEMKWSLSISSCLDYLTPSTAYTKYSITTMSTVCRSRRVCHLSSLISGWNMLYTTLHIPMITSWPMNTVSVGITPPKWRPPNQLPSNQVPRSRLPSNRPRPNRPPSNRSTPNQLLLNWPLPNR